MKIWLLGVPESEVNCVDTDSAVERFMLVGAYLDHHVLMRPGMQALVCIGDTWQAQGIKPVDYCYHAIQTNEHDREIKILDVEVACKMIFCDVQQASGGTRWMPFETIYA